MFTFSFPDVNGKVLSNEDPKFKGKVVVAIVTGTWCPNCHDEAQYLVPLYKKYRDQGLEIVALDFEEPEQQDELARVKAFVAKYGVEYTYLIAGAPAEMWEKVPQAVNLNTWPATIFVGRDGRVKRIHAGFAAPGERRVQRSAEGRVHLDDRTAAGRERQSTAGSAVASRQHGNIMSTALDSHMTRFLTRCRCCRRVPASTRRRVSRRSGACKSAPCTTRAIEAREDVSSRAFSFWRFDGAVAEW